MNSLDVFLMVFVAASAFHFSMKGFFNSAFILLGWASAVCAFTTRYKYLEEQLFSLDEQGEGHLGSYLISGGVAIVILWLCYYLGQKASLLVQKTGFAEGDRILGMLLGITLGWYGFNLFIYWAQFIIPIQSQSAWQNAQFRPLLNETQRHTRLISKTLLRRWQQYQRPQFNAFLSENINEESE